MMATKTMRKRKNVWLGGVILATTLLVAAPTNAQNVDPDVAVKAQSLYEQAIRLMNEKKYAEACSKLEEVTRLLPQGVGARLVLGECYVELQQFARAWVQYGVAEANATMAGKATSAANAHAEADKLRPKLVMLTITVSVEERSVPGLSVTLDGVEQNASTWETPIAVDLGKHLLQATAPQRQPWSLEVNFESGGVSIKQDVPVLKPMPVEVKPPVHKPVPVEVKAPPLEPPRPPRAPSMPSSRTWMRPMGIVALGVGASGLIVGGVLGGMAISKRDESNTAGGCMSNNRCPALGVAMREEMLDLAHGSTAGWITAGAFGALGTILLFAAPLQKEDDANGASVTWQMNMVPGGMGVQGVW